MANTFTYYPGLGVGDRRVGLTRKYYPLNQNSFIMPETAGSTVDPQQTGESSPSVSPARSCGLLEDVNRV